MEKFNAVYSVCLNDKNINVILDVIREDIKLSDRSTMICAKMIADTLKKNIDNLSRPPRSKEELRYIVDHLNKLCIKSVTERIVKKNPELYINHKKQVSKEQMRRNLDTFGPRENQVPSRPHSNARKTPEDDETFFSMQPNDTGFSGANEEVGGYASAWGNHLITNVPSDQQPNQAGQQQGQPQQMIHNQPHSQRDGSFDQRFQKLMNDRNSMGQRQKPETPDFTLDGSGNDVKQKKMLRKMQEQSMGGGMNGGMGGMSGMMGNGMPDMMGNGMSNMMGNGMPDMMSGMGMGDNPYASLLGAGAPPPSQMPQQNFGQNNPMNQMPQQQEFGNQWNNFMSQMNQNNQNNQSGNFMGMGNPLMPLSSTNIMMDQMGNGNVPHQTVKTAQLQNAYERKMAERSKIDIETGQPVQSNNLQSFNGMQNIPSGGMGMMNPSGGMGMMNPSMGMPGIMNPSGGMPGMMNPSMGMPGMMNPSGGMGMMNPSMGMSGMMNPMQIPMFPQ
jgi:hypothetical protein